MARIRQIEINRFRAIKSFIWSPASGMNCLLGPGDSGKSTILDAIDLCLGARRTANFTDADFFGGDVEEPILIRITIGDLEDGLKSFERYGDFLRGFNPIVREIEDEPERNLETVLTIQLQVDSDLEAVWSLFSEKAEAREVTRNLGWADRQRLAPTRIGAFVGGNLSWRRGSVLNALTDDDAPNVSVALAKAAREARAKFGNAAEVQLTETIKIVSVTAGDLGIDVGGSVTALLDTQAVSFGSGTISLHNDDGVPLSRLGTGSARLLVAGLQRKAAQASPILLVDELEHGLEPHRIIRFIGSMGAKEEQPPLQVFCTTHSPIALRELSGSQLFVLRETRGKHEAQCVGASDESQGAVRAFPEAFLSKSVIVCEGASEVGLLRGFDLWRCRNGETSIFANGAALVDGGGGSPDKLAERALAFQALGYRVSVFRDDDKQPTKGTEQRFKDNGGQVFFWSGQHSLEEELFDSLDNTAVGLLLDYAVECFGDELIDQHIRSKSEDGTNLTAIQAAILFDKISEEGREILAASASSNKTENCWFKSVSRMENVGRDIVGPHINNADEEFQSKLISIFSWIAKGDK